MAYFDGRGVCSYKYKPEKHQAAADCQEDSRWLAGSTRPPPTQTVRRKAFPAHPVGRKLLPVLQGPGASEDTAPCGYGCLEDSHTFQSEVLRACGGADSCAARDLGSNAGSARGSGRSCRGGSSGKVCLHHRKCCSAPLLNHVLRALLDIRVTLFSMHLWLSPACHTVPLAGAFLPPCCHAGVSAVQRARLG